eukprot:ctg_2499.g595
MHVGARWRRRPLACQPAPLISLTGAAFPDWTRQRHAGSFGKWLGNWQEPAADHPPERSPTATAAAGPSAQPQTAERLTESSRWIAAEQIRHGVREYRINTAGELEVAEVHRPRNWRGKAVDRFARFLLPDGYPDAHAVVAVGGGRRSAVGGARGRRAAVGYSGRPRTRRSHAVQPGGHRIRCRDQTASAGGGIRAQCRLRAGDADAAGAVVLPAAGQRGQYGQRRQHRGRRLHPRRHLPFVYATRKPRRHHRQAGDGGRGRRPAGHRGGHRIVAAVGAFGALVYGGLCRCLPRSPVQRVSRGEERAAAHVEPAARTRAGVDVLGTAAARAVGARSEPLRAGHPATVAGLVARAQHATGRAAGRCRPRCRSVAVRVAVVQARAVPVNVRGRARAGGAAARRHQPRPTQGVLPVARVLAAIHRRRRAPRPQPRAARTELSYDTERVCPLCARVSCARLEHRHRAAAAGAATGHLEVARPAGSKPCTRG